MESQQLNDDYSIWELYDVNVKNNYQRADQINSGKNNITKKWRK
jgi:hypothetical protein